MALDARVAALDVVSRRRASSADRLVDECVSVVRAMDCRRRRQHRRHCHRHRVQCVASPQQTVVYAHVHPVL